MNDIDRACAAFRTLLTEQQARAVEVFAVRADKLSAKAKVPHSAQ